MVGLSEMETGLSHDRKAYSIGTRNGIGVDIMRKTWSIRGLFFDEKYIWASTMHPVSSLYWTRGSRNGTDGMDIKR
jgi:hypothetical protein